MSLLKKLRLEEKVAGFFPFIKKSIQGFFLQSKLIREKLKDLPKTNFELGIRHLQRGNLDDAVMRFKMVSFLVPDHVEAIYNLGICLTLKGENERAEENFKKVLELAPEYTQAEYMLQKLRDPSTVGNIPDNVIKTNLHPVMPCGNLKGTSVYPKSRLLASTLLQHINDKNPNLTILDIEAGSGIAAAILKFDNQVVRSLDGVTVSGTLAEKLADFKINNVPVYDSCVWDSYLHHLETSNKSYDAIIIESAWKWFGDVSAYLKAIHERLQPGGLCLAVVPVDDIPKSEEFRLHIKSDDFSYSESYIDFQIKAAGFEQLDVNSDESSNKKIILFRRK